MNKLLTIIGLAAFSLVGVNAQVVLNSLGSYTQNFNGYTAFNAAAQPTGWTTVFLDDETYRGFTSNGTSVAIAGTSGGSITSGGLFSWGEELAGPSIGDSSFAWQGTGSTNNMATTVLFTNNTGVTITEISVSFDIYQWRQGAGGTGGGRASTLDLTATANLSGLNAFNFTAAASGIGNPAVGRAFGDAAPAAFTADTDFAQTLIGLNIADGDTFSFTFTYDRGAGSGSAQGIAMDNFSLTTVPEPSSAVLLGIVGLLTMVARRRGARKI